MLNDRTILSYFCFITLDFIIQLFYTWKQIHDNSEDLSLKMIILFFHISSSPAIFGGWRVWYTFDDAGLFITVTSSCPMLKGSLITASNKLYKFTKNVKSLYFQFGYYQYFDTSRIGYSLTNLYKKRKNPTICQPKWAVTPIKCFRSMPQLWISAASYSAMFPRGIL